MKRRGLAGECLASVWEEVRDFVAPGIYVTSDRIRRRCEAAFFEIKGDGMCDELLCGNLIGEVLRTKERFVLFERHFSKFLFQNRETVFLKRDSRQWLRDFKGRARGCACDNEIT